MVRRSWRTPWSRNDRGPWERGGGTELLFSLAIKVRAACRLIVHLHESSTNLPELDARLAGKSAATCTAPLAGLRVRYGARSIASNQSFSLKIGKATPVEYVYNHIVYPCGLSVL